MVRIPDLPPDEAFPHLSAVTDPEPMRALLQRELPGYAEGRLHIERLKIERFQYKPRKRCSICYSLEVRAAGDRGGRQILSGLLDGGGRARARYERELAGAGFSPALAPAVHYLGDVDMVVWGFPNDPAMKRLFELFDRDAFFAILGRHRDALGLPAEGRWGSLDTRVAKYVPGDRCVLEHRAWPEGVASGEPALHLYSKTYDSDRAGAIFRTMRRLWESDGRRAGDLCMPEPLAFDAELRTVFLRPLAGLHALRGPGDADLPQLAPRIAALLASIHRTPLPGLLARHPADELADVDKARGMLASLSRAHGARAGAILRRLRGDLATTSGLPQTPLHGAFRLSQLLVAGERIALLDFDGLRIGNPVSDVGSLCAHLLYQPVKGALAPGLARAALGRFARAYRAAVPWGLPEPALRWFTAACLVGKHAKKCVKRAKQQADQKIEQLLVAAEAVLDGAEDLS